MKYLLIKKKNIAIDFYYSSLQLRANKTLRIIQNILNDEKDYKRAWELNERHYGALTGLNKIEMSKKLGKDKFKREILFYCKSKAELTYVEAREQFARKVLESNDYYNGHIRVRVHKQIITKEKAST